MGLVILIAVECLRVGAGIVRTDVISAASRCLTHGAKDRLTCLDKPIAISAYDEEIKSALDQVRLLLGGPIYPCPHVPIGMLAALHLATVLLMSS